MAFDELELKRIDRTAGELCRKCSPSRRDSTSSRAEVESSAPPTGQRDDVVGHVVSTGSASSAALSSSDWPSMAPDSLSILPPLTYNASRYTIAP